MLFRSAFFQAARVALAADSGVVDENVEIGGAAEGRVAGILHRPDTVERTDVGLHGESLAARRRDLRHQRLGRVARSEHHTSELQSLMRLSYAVFCLKNQITTHN